jgi:hypothetical protein
MHLILCASPSYHMPRTLPVRLMPKHNSHTVCPMSGSHCTLLMQLTYLVLNC